MSNKKHMKKRTQKETALQFPKEKRETMRLEKTESGMRKYPTDYSGMNIFGFCCPKGSWADVSEMGKGKQ